MKLSKGFKIEIQGEETDYLTAIAPKLSDIFDELYSELPKNALITNTQIVFFEPDLQNTVTIIPAIYYSTLSKNKNISKPIHVYFNHTDNSISGYIEIKYKNNSDNWFKNIWGKMTNVFEGVTNNGTRSFA